MSPLLLALLALLGTATGHTPSRRELIARRAEATTTIKPKVDTSDEGDSDEGTPTTTAAPDIEQSSGTSTDDVEVESHTTSAPETQGTDTNEDRQGVMTISMADKVYMADNSMRRRKLDTPAGNLEDSADGSSPDQSTGQEDSSSGTSDTNTEQSHQSEPDKSDASETTTIAPTTETTTTDV